MYACGNVGLSLHTDRGTQQVAGCGWARRGVDIGEGER
jgi:hypothetical protein